MKMVFDFARFSNSCFFIIICLISSIKITRENIPLIKRNSKVQSTVLSRQLVMSFLDSKPHFPRNQDLIFFQSSHHPLTRLYIWCSNNIIEQFASEDPKTDKSSLRSGAFDDDLSRCSKTCFHILIGSIFLGRSSSRQHSFVHRECFFITFPCQVTVRNVRS